MARRPGALLRFVFRVPTALYRWHAGWLLGHRFLLLHHTGRRSGASYQTVLEVVRYSPESREAVVMAGWGRKADWYRNIEAHGPNQITIGRRTYAVDHRLLGEDEAAAALGEYEDRNRLIRPIVRRVLGTLADTRHDGSDASRRVIVGKLPLVALTPAAT